MSVRAFFALQANRHQQEITTLRLRQRLNSASPHLLIEKYQVYVDNLDQRLGRVCRNLAINPTRELSSLATRLRGLSTRHTLQRGYTILRDAVDGRVISNAAAVQRGQTVEAELAHGWLQCTVERANTRGRGPTDRSYGPGKPNSHT